MNVFRTYLVRASDGPLAVAICDALGYPEKGMFVVQVNDGGNTVGYISTGIVDDDSPIHADAAGLLTALNERNPGHGITLAQCQQFRDALDLTDAEPFGRMDAIRAEIAASADPLSFPEWQQPQGTVGMYDRDDIVRHGGNLWKSMVRFNVWEPGVSGWRPLWSSEGGEPLPPEWTQPTGAHDAPNIGDLRSWQGKVYRSLVNGNAWGPPPDFPALWALVE